MSVEARMNRLFRSDGKCLKIAMDHGSHNEVRFLSGLEDFGFTLQKVAAASPDAILLSIGQAHRLQTMRLDHKPSLVLRCDLTNIYRLPRPDHAFCRGIEEPVQQALRLDAVAVLYNLFFVPDDSAVYQQCLENICRAKSECERYGMPLVVEPLILDLDEDSGAYQISGDLERFKALARQTVELGADVIKADPTDAVEEYAAVVEIAAGIPLLPRGGDKVSEEEILLRTSALMASGASGVVYGRNVFQHKNTAGIIRALNAIVHENASAEDALRIIRGPSSMS